MAKLNEMIREFRDSVNQSVEGLALLMGMPPEEYARLEEDWIPPDDVLERICSLFEWNFQDTKRSALQSSGEPAESQAPSPPPKLLQLGTPPEFSEMLQESREAVGQSPEGVATLLGIDSQFYLSIEQGLTPSDDLLQQICSLFHWNYRQVRQRLINRNASMLFQRPTASTPVETTELPAAPAPGPALGTRIREQREAVGQTLDGLSILLEISPEFLEEIENGTVHPDAALLRRIAALFQWNFHALQLDEQKRRLPDFHPVVMRLPNEAQPQQRQRLKSLQNAIAEPWLRLTAKQQESVLAQLELIRDTVRLWGTPPAAPAPKPPAAPEPESAKVKS